MTTETATETIEAPAARKTKTNRFDTANDAAPKVKRASRATKEPAGSATAKKPVQAKNVYSTHEPDEIKPKLITRGQAQELARLALEQAKEEPNDALFLVIDGQKIVFAEEAAHVVTLSPAAAGALLARNEGNRQIRPQNLNKIITDLNNGDYSFNGSSVVISTDGLLLDAQHRLLAVIETGVSIRTVIVTGVLVKAQGDMDSGKIRTLSENLHRAGETYTSQLSSALFGIQSWERGERGSDSSKGLMTNNTSLAFLAQHPEIREIVKEAFTLSTNITGLTHKQVCQLIWAFDKINVEDRKGFFADLLSGAGLTEGSPVLALRNFLLKDASSNARVTPQYRTALTCKAWNFYRQGQTVHTLKFTPGGASPEAFPEPV